MVCPPFGGAVCRGHAQCPAFAPSCSEVAVGLFGLFVASCPEFAPAAHAHSYFSSLIVSLHLLLEEMFVQVQVLQQRVPDPRSQPVSV